MTSNFQTEPTIDVGSYTVSPAVRQHKDGAFQASVRIRGGQGASAHQRIFHFTPRFASPEGARLYAITQGHCWLQNREVR